MNSEGRKGGEKKKKGERSFQRIIDLNCTFNAHTTLSTPPTCLQESCSITSAQCLVISCSTFAGAGGSVRSHVSVLGSSHCCFPYQQLLAPISCWERCHGEPRLMFQPPSSRSSFGKRCGDVVTPRPKPGLFSSLWEILAPEPSGLPSRRWVCPFPSRAFKEVLFVCLRIW